MKIINWETMKKKAKEEFWQSTDPYRCSPNANAFLALHAAVLEEPKRKPREVLKEWQDKGTEIIDKWDIRCCMKLAECFPSCLPKNIPLTTIPTIDQDENSEWIIIFE